MTTRQPFFRGGGFVVEGDSEVVPLILPRWEPVGSLTESEVWGVQELCSARIASRWSADTDFGRRGAVPTARVVVVSFFGGGRCWEGKACQNVPNKKSKSANDRGNI